MERKKILFISYFFPPFDSVGVKRIAYWFNNITKYDFEATVFTAIEQTDENDKIIYVKPHKSKSLTSIFTEDKGIDWIEPLKAKLSNYKSSSFDFILISGGPFLQMLITKFLKNNFTAKIILDFRDPFYANPRFQKSKIKDSIKLYLQNKFLKYTDLVTTVNTECAKFIQHNNIQIIDNGFDESILNKVEEQLTKDTNSNVTAVATGKVYDDFNINEFFNAIKKDTQINFDYIGAQEFKKYSELYNHGGLLPYKEALQFINNSDVCVLFTGGKTFESSTKIFDYLGLNKTIIIITEGKPKTGNLHQITKEYPNVFWSENNVSDILNAFAIVKTHKNIKVDTSKYARSEGLKVLIQILTK